MSNDTDTNAYEDEWAADKEATDAQAAADAGLAASKKADADPDFNYDEPGTIDAASAAQMDAAPAPVTEPIKAMTFKETFAAHRNAGAKTFEWNGKKYTTDLKTPAPSTGAKIMPPVGRSSASASAAPSTSLSQKLGGEYAAVKSAADRMPVGTSAAARSALNEDVTRRQRAYEQAAAAEKSATSLTQKLGSDYASVKTAADNMPAGTSPAARQALNTMVSASQRTYEQAAAAEKAGTSVTNGHIPYVAAEVPSPAKTSFSSGRNYPAAVARKEVPSPVKTSFGSYASAPTVATERIAAVPPVNLVTAKVQAPAVPASVRAHGDSPARTSFSNGRNYPPAPVEVPSPAKTSFSSGRTYPGAPEATRR